MEKSIDGISEACRVFNTPVISGNVSMYNQAKDTPIFPTPIIGMVGLFASLTDITPSRFQMTGDAIYVIGETTAEFGGSELQHLLKEKYEGKPPTIDLEIEAERQKLLLQAIRKGLIQSATDISEGGLAVQLANSLFDQGLGAHINIEHEDPTVLLFSESQSRFLITVKQEKKDALEQIIPDAKQVGIVTDDERLLININDQMVIDEDVNELCKLWKEAMPNLLKSTT